MQPHLYVSSCHLIISDTLTLSIVLDARDAWIQADANRYNGAHRCLLWNVFASRGFGMDAEVGSYINSDTIPNDC